MPEFHVLRPWWLTGLAAAALFWWVLSRREDVRERWRDIIAPHLLELQDSLPQIVQLAGGS